jgi:hypothetical protein
VEDSLVDTFECQCKDEFRIACEGLPYYAEHEGKRYCVLHFPSENKANDFKKAMQSKLERNETRFVGVYFPSDANFHAGHFSDRADFSEARFIKRADFSAATFSEAADFSYATFSEASEFARVAFRGMADFTEATFTERVEFVGTVAPESTALSRMPSHKSIFNFSGIKLDKPESSTFRSMALRASWFTNVDARNIRFTNVFWYGLPNGPKGSFDDEIEALKGTDAPYELLAKVCRELAVNSEENRTYTLASEFNYWALDAQRRQLRRSTFAPERLIWWYWALSGYGERHWRAALGLVGILFGFALFYLFLGFVPVEELSVSGVLGATWQSIVYSVAFMTRQNAALNLNAAVDDYGSVLLKFLIVLEGILGPLQIALLALALRRKFMR